MKLQGILGKGTGKLGNAVFAVSGGEQIMREYNPNVSNPNTEKQVAQRAKLKLMSQLAASLSSVIAIPKQGLVGSRNLFIKENIGLATFEEGVAKIEVPGIQLTKGRQVLNGLVAVVEGNNYAVNIDGPAPAEVSRVAYIVCKVNDGNQLQVVTSVVVSERGASGNFATTIPSSGINKIAIFAYGMIDKSSATTAKYESYEVESADELAQLVTSRAFGIGDYAMTATVGAYIQ